jgi:enoyl-[acyl-carrier protein] reductase III
MTDTPHGNPFDSLRGKWALILGASSGFGAATAKALAAVGVNIAGVHLDLRTTLPAAQQVIADIQTYGVQTAFFNTNAADAARRSKVLDELDKVLHGATIHVFMHSLAFGTLKPFIADQPEDAIDQAQMEMTSNVMAHSLVYWTQDLVRRQMLGAGSRIFSMTSEGSARVVPNYGAVSAAKAALESHTRQLAMELGVDGIQVNCIQAGVTDTPALRKIPGHERMIAETMRRNPSGRMTTPEDVANTIVALSLPTVRFVSGSMIFVDGGEAIVG